MAKQTAVNRKPGGGVTEPGMAAKAAADYAAMQKRRRKEESERRERARVAHDERVARRNAYRERGYRDEPKSMVVERTPPDTGPAAQEEDTSLLAAVADMEVGDGIETQFSQGA